jgi:hypothetical protein
MRVGERSLACVASQGVAALLAAASGKAVSEQQCSDVVANDAASRKRCGNAAGDRRHAGVPPGSVTLQNLERVFLTLVVGKRADRVAGPNVSAGE